MEGAAHSPKHKGTSHIGYIPALDGMRGIAALGVLLLHYLTPFATALPVLSFPGGHYGVDVFFALSGFLISTLLIEEYQRRGRVGLRSFWMRRALRLLPALVLVLATLVVLGGLVDLGVLPYGQGLDDDPGGAEGGLPWDYLPFWPGIGVSLLPISNLLWVTGFVFKPISVSWTLAIEDQFYLVWPFLLVFLLTRRSISLRTCAFLVTGLAVAAVIWRNVVFWFIGGLMAFQRSDFHTAELLIGCAAALVIAANLVPNGPSAQRALGVLAWASLAGILLMFVSSGTLYLNAVTTLIAILTVVVIAHLVVNRGGRLAGLLAWPPLVGIGQVSYGLYLWHWVWLQYPISVDPILFPLLALGLTCASVLVSYYLVERPALRQKRRFQRVDTSHPANPGAVQSVLRRRDLLPLLGIGSVAAAALAVYGLSGRRYSREAVASASSATSTPTPTRTPRPTRVPRKPRRADRAKNRPQANEGLDDRTEE